MSVHPTLNRATNIRKGVFQFLRAATFIWVMFNVLCVLGKVWVPR